MGFLKSVKSAFKKVGKVAKKALPYAALAAPFIPGVSGAVTGAISKIGGVFGGSSAQSAANNNFDEMSGGYSPPPTPPPTPPSFMSKLGTAIGDNLGAITSAGVNIYGQNVANQANAKLAQQQMDFQRDQTSTSYQRGVADMKAAGLNPMLAYSQGGAASGSGASANMQSETSAGVTSALSATMMKQELQNLQAQLGKTQAETGEVDARTENIRAQTMTELNRPENVRAQTGSYTSSARQADQSVQESLARVLGYDLDNALKQGTLHANVARALFESDTAGKRFEIADKESRGLTLDNMLKDGTLGARISAAIQEARRSGYQADAQLLENVLESYRLPGAAAEAQKSGSWVGTNVSPWLNDATKAGSTARALRQPGR